MPAPATCASKRRGSCSRAKWVGGDHRAVAMSSAGLRWPGERNAAQARETTMYASPTPTAKAPRCSKGMLLGLLTAYLRWKTIGLFSTRKDNARTRTDMDSMATVAHQGRTADVAPTICVLLPASSKMPGVRRASMAPAICAVTYCGKVLGGTRLARTIATEMAGFRCAATSPRTHTSTEKYKASRTQHHSPIIGLKYCRHACRTVNT
mmetsp:Transcript_20281/g.36825  ORF Transcript_20281/g.36825 Transcript_20281/m.36825 type:complete len:208 (+) Transcript_20281:876-1499(+)